MWWWVLIWTLLVADRDGLPRRAPVGPVGPDQGAQLPSSSGPPRSSRPLEAEVDRLGERDPAPPLAVFQDPRDLRRQRERDQGGRCESSARRAGRDASRAGPAT